MNKGVTLWWTGRPDLAGPILSRVAEELRGRGLRVEHLNENIIKNDLSKELDFGKEDQKWIGHLIKLLTRNGVVVVTSFSSLELQDYLRERIEKFVEIKEEAEGGVEQVIKRLEDLNYIPKQKISLPEEEMVKERLKSLGYL